jgi:hypothetical protein
VVAVHAHIRGFYRDIDNRSYAATAYLIVALLQRQHLLEAKDILNDRNVSESFLVFGLVGFSSFCGAFIFVLPKRMLNCFLQFSQTNTKDWPSVYFVSSKVR